MISRVAFCACFVAGLHTALGNVQKPPCGHETRVLEPGLRVRFLGTGAADWMGKDVRGEQRRLSSVLLDNRVLIDLTSVSLDMIPTNAKPEVVFYTHSHSDHFDPAAVKKLGVKRAYVHESWYAFASERLPFLEVIPLKTGESAEECGIRLTSCPASHATGLRDEQASMYLVEKGPTRLLYATDTAGIPAIAARLAGIDAHDKRGKGITALIMEATMGVDHADDYRIYAHSSVATVAQIARVLKQTDRYHPRFPDQKIYLTHMARTLHGTHKEVEKTVPAPLVPAYDGLEVTF